MVTGFDPEGEKVQRWKSFMKFNIQIGKDTIIFIDTDRYG
jgi:hypothetical protein